MRGAVTCSHPFLLTKQSVYELALFGLAPCFGLVDLLAVERDDVARGGVAEAGQRLEASLQELGFLLLLFGDQGILARP